MRKFSRYYFLILGLFFLIACPSSFADTQQENLKKFLNAAEAQTHEFVIYDASYFKLDYPMGDPPKQFGVCTDVVIRAYRKIGLDLQQLVHEDMAANFSIYPAKRIWNQKSTDTNIDHRRVQNLQLFFTRFGKSLSVTDKAKDYQPGDLVTWMVSGNLPHIGLVSNRKSEDGERYLIIHNIGRGPKLEDRLFDFPITGHYRYKI